MAACIVLDQGNVPGRPVGFVQGLASSSTVSPFVVGEATRTGDQWSCPAGTHLLLTVEEVNTPPEFVLDLPALGITPEHILIVASMGAALVLGSYFTGWGVGLAKDLIKKF